MANYYVDLTAGSDVAAGSEAAPFRTFAPVNSGGLWDGNQINVKRGSVGVVNSVNRANIVASSGKMTAYGDAAADLPIIDANGTTFNPLWMQSGGGSAATPYVIEQMHVRRAPADGIVIGPSTGNTLEHVTVQDCLGTENTQNPLYWGSFALRVGLVSLDGGAISDIIVRRFVARDNGGHGFKALGCVTRATFIDCVAIRSGLRTPAHGWGTAGHFIDATAGAWTDTGATVGGGKVWSKSGLTSGYRSSITSWFYVYVLGAGPTYYKLPYSATPTAPEPGECGCSGVGGNLLINLGAISPTLLSSVQAIHDIPQHVHFVNCGAAYTVDGVTQIEGDGGYFDNGSTYCYSHDCWSFNNQGNGFFMNDATHCGHYGGLAYMNLKGGAYIARGDQTNMLGNTLVCYPGTRGIRYSTGNQGAKARRNQIVGATDGIWTNDEATNEVAEDENVFIATTTRLSAVSSAGARSADRAALGSLPSSALALRAGTRLAEAEALA